MLECEKKLIYVNRHLDEIKKSYPLDKATIDYELSAFVLEARSVIECMNEDFNIRYHLDLPDGEDLKKQLQALKPKNELVESYLDWHQNYYNLKINKHQVFRFFFNHETGLRNLADHRRAVSPNMIRVRIEEKNPGSGLGIEDYNIETGEYEKHGYFAPTAEIMGVPEKYGPDADLFFCDDDGNVIIPLNIFFACIEIASVLESFVFEFKQKFIDIPD
jgi:hypothetical protein